MGDGGLVLGAIYLNFSKLKSKKYFNKISKNVFYGTSPKISYSSKYEYEKLEFTPKKLYDYISNCLIEDKIVGVINNRMEFGPRALGNRSILANPMTDNITDILNYKLTRSEFMPFAPMIRIEDAKEILENFSYNDHSSRFMTITYNVKKKYRIKLKNILHHDNTFRVQIIDNKENKLCYNILTCFYKKTKIPCIINTSFNVHDEPIVMNLADGIKALDLNVVDLIVNGTNVIKKRTS